MQSIDDMRFAQWPKDCPRPTPAQMTAAQMRYDLTRNPHDFSDYGCGLGFVMATYSRFVWWPLFFPEDVEGVRIARQETHARMAERGF